MRIHVDLDKLPADLIVVNCGHCGQLCQAWGQVRQHIPEAVRVKVSGRPSCKPCYRDPPTFWPGMVGEAARTEGQRDGMKKTRS